MNVGDIVRVSMGLEHSCIEGTITRVWSINGIDAFQVCYLKNKYLSLSVDDVEIHVIHAAEPEGLGSVFYDEYNNPWTKYSIRYSRENWISETGITSTWEGLQP